ncbi:MAG: TlpA family protein disulfide reductase, partial [Planctomycetes bacterium]|nr:TlpA family protein disulfide reductase [Planctomycetota bacterium]
MNTARISKIVSVVGVISLAVAAPPTHPVEAAPPNPDIALKTGLWHAWLHSPGGELPFDLDIEAEDGKYRVWIINGEERIEIPRVTFLGGELVLDIDYYDSKISAYCDPSGSQLLGVWIKQGRGDKKTGMRFQASAGAAPRFKPIKAKSPAAKSIEGKWEVKFASSKEPAIAVFEQRSDGTASGTFLTTTGDYRYLAGRIDGDRLRLSGFDGAHAFLFDARVKEDGTLAGDFWSRDTWHDTWTAKRNAGAVLPDSFALTKSVDGKSFAELSFPDLDGRVRSLGDPEFAGKARIIEIFGTWCPNCNDATKYMVELHQKYGSRGLKIIGLAFELTGDPVRDARQVRIYVQSHAIEYPVLIAGT